MKMNKWFLILCLTAVFQLSGCPRVIKIFPSDNFTKEARSKYQVTFAELERNRQLWQESKVENYDFEIACNTGAGTSTISGVAVKVREGKMISIEKSPKDHPGEIYESENVETVGKIFEFMKQELDDDRIIKAEYNQNLGYPERIRITHSYAIDAYMFCDIIKFEIIK